MAYEKTLWEAREGSDLDRFEKAQETARSVILRNAPNNITKPGTKFSVQKMNKIEQGIFDAHKMITSEETERETAVGLLAKADELLERMITAEGHSRLQADAALQVLIDLIMGLIPNQASISNLLADKNFVNSTVSNLAAWFLTPDSLGTHQWPSLNALRTGPWYSGGTPKQPSQNDYAIFINQDEDLGPVNSVWRALFSNELWSPQYKVNDTPFTAAQLAAINSNITQALVNKLTNPDTVPTQYSAELITSGGVFSWFGADINTLLTNAKNVIDALNELFVEKINNSEKGTANGVATLDGEGKIPQSQIPSVPAQINRTINLSTSSTAANPVQDTGGDLTLPVKVTITNAAVNADLPTATNAPLQTYLQNARNKLRDLDENKADKTSLNTHIASTVIHISALERNIINLPLFTPQTVAVGESLFRVFNTGKTWIDSRPIYSFWGVIEGINNAGNTRYICGRTSSGATNLNVEGNGRIVLSMQNIRNSSPSGPTTAYSATRFQIIGNVGGFEINPSWTTATQWLSSAISDTRRITFETLFVRSGTNAGQIQFFYTWNMVHQYLLTNFEFVW